jgi:hypothetical protein
MNGGGVFGCTTGVVVGGAGSVFQQASFDHNFNDGVYVGYSTVLTNCTFHTNSRTTNNVWSNINANGTGITVAVIGCRAAPLDSGYGTNNPAYMVNNTGSGNTIWLFGNYNEGATFGTGWTNYSGANAPILKGTSDGISQGQFLGALGTGLVKNTTTTGVLSIGAAGTDYVAPGGALGTPSSGTLTNCTFPTLNQNTTGSAATLTTPRNINGVSFNGSANITIIPRINTTASSATPAINVDTTDQFNITALAAAITSMTSGLSGTPVDGQKLMIRIKDNGTARAITWGTSFVSSGVATLLATTVASKTHRVGLIYDSAMAKWTCVAVDAAGA